MADGTLCHSGGKSAFEWRGAKISNYPSREKCFCLTYFAGRPDVNRVLEKRYIRFQNYLYSTEVNRKREVHIIKVGCTALRISRNRSDQSFMMPNSLEFVVVFYEDDLWKS